MNSKYAQAILTALVFGSGCSGDGGTGSDQISAPGQLGNQPTPTTMTSGMSTDMTGVEGTATTTDMMSAMPPPVTAPVLDNGGIVDVAGETEAAQMAMACESASEPTSIQGVVLAFAFDVSGSMGLESAARPYESRQLKWEPVVAATKAFFSDPTSQGVSATLTFFPSDKADMIAPAGGTAGGGGGFGGGGIGGGGGGDICDGDEYATAGVPLTALPSDTFAAAIDAVTPAADGAWRIGTPTNAVLEGVIQQVRALKDADTENKNKYVIVLVTDGEPAFCEPVDVNTVADTAASVKDEFPVYVIGVANPSLASLVEAGVVTAEDAATMAESPDSVGNLNTIADSAGTGPAFIVNTDDPAATTTSFLEVVQKIRDSSFTCQLPIPEAPAGQTFDPAKVNVSYTNHKDTNGDGVVGEDEMGLTQFVYDESCTEMFAWHYDDAVNPTVIQMCGNVCDAIKADYKNSGSLDVEFGCVHRVATQK